MEVNANHIRSVKGNFWRIEFGSQRKYKSHLGDENTDEEGRLV